MEGFSAVQTSPVLPCLIGVVVLQYDGYHVSQVALFADWTRLIFDNSLWSERYRVCIPLPCISVILELCFPGTQQVDLL